MQLKTILAVIVGIGCVGAAATGGYLAMRQNSADARIDSQAAARPADQAVAAPAPDPSAATPAPAAIAPAPDAASASDASKKPAAPKTAKPVTHVDSAKPAAPTPMFMPDPVQPKPATVDAPPPPPPPPPVVDLPPPPPPDPPKPQYLELTVAAQSVIGVRLDTSVSTDTAKIEDKVTAHVTRNVEVSGHVVIPAGARLEGTVTTIEHGGKFKDKARLGVKFNTLLLSDNTRLPLQTETIFREDDSSSSAAASKVGGGAVIGTILGAMLGGKKGAAVGAGVGGGAGTAAVATGKGNEVELPAGTMLTLHLTAPATITIEKQ